MVLIVKGKEDTNVICGEFPSPYGDYGSYQSTMEFLIGLAVGTRFRPLTGIMVLINTRTHTTANRLKRFPSPYGDYGSYL